MVGGWALDLWHGEPTCVHEDLKFSVLACQAQRYRGILSDLEFFSVRDGKLDHLPLIEPQPMDVWQQWGADIGFGRWRVDMMVDRGSPDMWIYKRDPSFTLPRAKAIRATAGGIRYLARHIVLLFNARHVREKDQWDFRNALPRLECSEKAALRRWLEVLHPWHAWIQELQSC
ncbi:conserved hypothetical protein [Agrobacterium tumefaciens str. B6]|uniref:Amino acid transporter n=1 Tax=Agrobacterium tumefaciens str. B6 TaxID=1183423 RepID=A0A822VFL2_AGRTU|nr:amino acid transporter [Agrobacterium tumefaciens]CVI25576.1 conserved hypothetical protein [Agrobacterium tumefaciens str. B6]